MVELYHVAQVAPLQAVAIRDEVTKLGFEVFHPTRVETRRRRHVGWVQTLHSLMPGYMFIRFNPHSDSWRRICSVRGVTGFLGPDPEHPTAVPQAIMDDFIHRYAAGEFQDKPAEIRQLLPGEKGRVLAGPFETWIGECIYSSTKRVELMLGRVRTSFLPKDVAAA